jgi:hypothetical protein
MGRRGAAQRQMCLLNIDSYCSKVKKIKSLDLKIFPQLTTPVLEYKRGALIIASYISILLFTLMYQTNEFENGIEGISISLLALLFLISIGIGIVSTQCSAIKSEILLPVVLTILYPVSIYFGINTPLFSIRQVCNDCNVWPFRVALGVQTVTLFMVILILSRPVVPESVIQSRSFEVHLTNWWRVTQTILSLSIALGIGLTAQFLIDSSSVGIVQLIPLIFGIGIGLLIIIGFIFRKMFAVEHMVNNMG